MTSEEQKEGIRKEARKILDKFAKTLESVRVVKKDAGLFGSSVRSEFGGKKCDEDFRKRMFDNAPHKSGDCIIAEKGVWTE